MGGFANSWPLTKVLDIGGTKRCPKYTNKVDTGNYQGVSRQFVQDFLGLYVTPSKGGFFFTKGGSKWVVEWAISSFISDS